jgi:SAM-dependent methyltransferase
MRFMILNTQVGRLTYLNTRRPKYEAAFTRLTRQAVPPLLDAVNLRHGARILDVATGPGYVAAAAAARGARALGVDFSAPMVAHARAINPAVEFQEGDAEVLGRRRTTSGSLKSGLTELADKE